MTEKWVIISDLHLDAYTGGVPRAADVQARLGEVLDYIVAEKVALIFFLGDLCDPGEASHAQLAWFRGWIEDARAEVGVVSLICGNHDVVEGASGGSVLGVLRDASGYDIAVYDRPALSGSVAILPFASRANNYSPADFVDRHATARGEEPEIVFGHLNLSGIGPGSETKDMPRGRDVFWPLAEIKKRWPGALLVGGHYHRAQDWVCPETGLTVHIVGAPERFTHGEEKNQPSFTVYHRAERRLERVPFEGCRKVVTLTDSSKREEIDAAIAGGAIIRLRIKDPSVRYDACQILDATGHSYSSAPTSELESPDAEFAEEQGASPEEQAREHAAKLAREWPAAAKEFNDALEELVLAVGSS